MNRKGFTLVELLVVIGVLGVLAAAVVVVLNPAELLKQARDGQRFSDLSNINAALAFYASDAATPTIGATKTHSGATTTGVGWLCGATATGTGLGPTNNAKVDGTGWVGVNLASSTGGSPLSVLPVDPTNDISYHYCYLGENTNKTWELTAALESVKYMTTLDKDGTDGGNETGRYELGTKPGLDLMT